VRTPVKSLLRRNWLMDIPVANRIEICKQPSSVEASMKRERR